MIKGYSFRDPKYLILIIFVGSCAIVALGGYFYYNFRKEVIREEKLNDLKAIADLKEAQILQWKDERMADALTVTNNPFVRKHLKDIFPLLKPSFIPVLTGYIKETARDFNYHQIFIISRDGETLLTANPEKTLPESVIRKYLDISKNEINIKFSGFELDNDSLCHLNLLAPLNNGDEYLGFILLQIDPQQYLFPLIQFWPTPSQSSETLIVTVEEDTVVFLNELRHWHESSFRHKIPLSEKKVAAVMAVEGVRGFAEAVDYMDHPIIAYLKKIPGTDWYMIAKTDQDELFQPMQKETIMISGMMILFMFFIGLVSYLVLRNYLNSFFINRVNDELGLRSTNDVSLRKLHEQQIQKINRLYSTLLSINQTIVRAKKKETMLQDLCNILIEKGGYRMVSVGEFLSGEMVLVASAGHEPLGMAFKSRELVVCQDIDTDPLMASWRDEALRRGYRSSADFPIIFQEEVIGVINIYSAIVDWFDTEEIYLLEQLSQDIGYALGFFFIEDESKDIREELEASERKFSLVFESMNDGVAIHELIFDTDNNPVDYRLLDVNPMFEEITSIPSGEAIGAVGSELYQASPPPFFDIYKEIALTGKTVAFEEYFAPMEKHFRISVFSQEKNGFTTVFQDITEQVQAREYLKKMNTELEKRVTERTALLETANRELEAFAYSVSHDLKTPLRAISGFSNILETRYDSVLDEQGKHYLSNIIQAGYNMHQLIEDLLRYAGLGKVKAEFSSVDLKTFFETSVNDLHIIIESSHAVITIPKETMYVKGNTTMLTQIFTNLIMNALKYQPEGQNPSIDISWHEEDTYVIVSVKDNGIGIHEKFYKKVFQMFQRLHRDDQYQGTGIGLAIVKKAVEIHEGDVWISNSELGSGTTFCVKLIKSTKP